MAVEPVFGRVNRVAALGYGDPADITGDDLTGDEAQGIVRRSTPAAASRR